MDSSPQLAYLLAKMADEQPEKLPTPASCTAGMQFDHHYIQEEDVPTYSRMELADFLGLFDCLPGKKTFALFHCE